MRSAPKPAGQRPRSFGCGNSQRKKADRRRAGEIRSPESPMKDRKRIAITGIGMVTPVGNNAPTTWANLQAGRSGLGRITPFDASRFPVHIRARDKTLIPETIFQDPKTLQFSSLS